MGLLHNLSEKIGIRNIFLKQAIKYFYVGGLCTLLDFIILYIGAEYLGYNYLWTSIVSFICGIILNYYLCTYWVFYIRVVDNVPIEFSLYVLISLVGLAINTLVIWAGTEFIGLYFMTSKLLSATITYFWNFLARKFLLHYKWNN